MSERYLYIWQAMKESEARVCRVYGETGQVVVPESIAGRKVTEIGAYCFAAQMKLPEGELRITASWEKEKEAQQEKIESGQITKVLGEYVKRENLVEACGDYITYVELPNSVGKIGNCGFYNCRKLRELKIGKAATEIGSDAFMNCRALSSISVCCSVQEKSGIRGVLNQITSQVEVHFLGTSREAEDEAVLLYPEYAESYEEIGPAHIFGLNITGEGFRLRRCFKDEMVSFLQYDEAFEKACVEESELTLSRLALNRLRYPVELAEKAKTEYESYVKKHQIEIIKRLVKKQNQVELQFLMEKKILQQETVERAITLAGEQQWAEGVAQLLLWKQLFYPEQKKSRYAFDAF